MEPWEKELKPFLNEKGQLTAFPAKQKKKVLALEYLASKLEPGRRYTEMEINDLLGQWHTFRDPATLRRELYDFHCLNRTPDGRAYALADPQPTPEELGL